MNTIDQIKQRLTQLEPTAIDIFDDSASHAGHAGVRESGGGHYELTIVSPMFSGNSDHNRYKNKCDF